MLKVGVVGVGNISRAHIPAWEAFEDTELVALCDIRPEQTEKYEGKRKYTSFDEMLENEKLDIVDICLPTYLHADYSVKALERGINVVCEKPISLEKSDVKRIYGAAEKHGVKFMVAQVVRFFPEYELLKEIIDSGKYGKLLSGKMHRLSAAPAWSEGNWMRKEELSGLVPFDLHIHDLDFLVYALGKPMYSAPFRIKKTEQDVVQAVYNFGGAYIMCEAAWYAGKLPFSAGYRFQFEKAVITNENGSVFIYTDDGIMSDAADEKSADSENAGIPKSDGYANELRYFADCVLTGKNPDKIKPAELETVLDVLKSF